MNKIFLISFVCFLMVGLLAAQNYQLKGYIQSEQSPVAFATVEIQPWNKGAISDSEGFFQIEGTWVDSIRLMVSHLGYSPFSIVIRLDTLGSPLRIALEKGAIEFSQIVVSAEATGRTRGRAPLAVQVMDAHDFQRLSVATPAEGLCFQSGLRVESNCQTCQFTQLRMNGLTGSYTQILVDGRPIFNALLGLYGLEQIPASMLDRIEVIKGGGPVQFGAGAIGGTVNLITRRPDRNGFEIEARSVIQGRNSLDNMINGSVQKVSDSGKFGNDLLISWRERSALDVNGDGFSEIPKMENQSVGWRGYLQANNNSTLDWQLWSIREYRRGGDQLDQPAHLTLQSEERDHNILLGNLRYRTKLSANGLSSLDIFTGGQWTRRDHYTGAYGSPGWGLTRSLNVVSGAMISGELSDQNWTFGLDHQYEDTFDEIPAYHFLVDQQIGQWGLFASDLWQWNDHWVLDAGIRMDMHDRVDRPVLTPRVNILYDAGKTKYRANLSRGFKGPQAFEADLHISFAAGGIARVQLDPELRHETSESLSLSVDHSGSNSSSAWTWSMQGFFHQLHHNFILENQGLDTTGNILLRRTNGQGAKVYGISVEAGWRAGDLFQWESAWTFQRSVQNTEVQWSPDQPGERNFLRTPDVYGHGTLTLFPEQNWSALISGIFTGPMWVPHLAGAPGVTEDRLTRSPFFADIQFSVSRNWSIKNIQGALTWVIGVRNVLNAYQNDLDTGPDRDSNFVYGPALPRSFFMTLRWKSSGK